MGDTSKHAKLKAMAPMRQHSQLLLKIPNRKQQIPNKFEIRTLDDPKTEIHGRMATIETPGAK